jgi:16S rRNA (cytosine967-C5)-methyltransferase
MKSNVNRQSSINPDLEARHVAAEILCTLLTENMPLDVCMSRSGAYADLSDQNRAFCLRLMQCYLKHYGQIAQEIDTLLRSPIPNKFRYVQLQIGLAMAQIAEMDIPPYAAVNSAVELAKLFSEPHAGLTNAVLNKWIKEKKASLSSPLLTNIPAWIQERWGGILGTDTVADIAEVLVEEAPLDITFKSKTLKSDWLVQHGGSNASTIGESVRLTSAGRVSELAGYKAGEWWVQDVAASLPVLLMGEVKDRTVLDMCAAPGGKTMQLASRGAKVIALDSSKKRLELLSSNMQRTGLLDAELICADALKYTLNTSIDAILLDAPCSATGTLRRNPDILLLRNKKNLFEQLEKQRKLLARAAEIIPVGGILVYAVCSLEPEEGEMQIEHLLNTRQDIIVDLENIMLPFELHTSKLGMRTLPSMYNTQGGMDGFFMTKLRKI